MFRWTTVVAPWLFIVCSQANLPQLVAGHPYQDRFSTAHSRAMPSGAGAVNSSAGQVDPSSEVSGGCNGGNCPRPASAKLQLWVPDEATVYINGQRTKPQSLGGVHQNSRIYTLEGLGDGPRPAEIMVEQCNEHGRSERMQYGLLADAGGRYKIHFPVGFMWIEPPMHDVPEGALPIMEEPTIMSDGRDITGPAMIESPDNRGTSDAADSSSDGTKVGETIGKPNPERPDPSDSRSGFKLLIPDVLPAVPAPPVTKRRKL